ncbi:MAG: fumarylacetoacetate hydrolase family protein [Haliea sp.]|nr:fumarylacetoacetate hydrolase family protein [Haliea sp.]
MGISVVKYAGKSDDNACWGVLREGGIYRLNTEYATHRELMAGYFAGRAAFANDADKQRIAAEDVVFHSPIANDVQLFCQGLNYADHRAESGASNSAHEDNLLFMKAASSICGPNDTILRPADCRLLDYEIEVALVLKEAINKPVAISESDLPRYIGAVVMCNDVSARDLMFGAPMLQWFRGKSQRTFCPMGPVLYLMDEEDFSRLYTLQLTLLMNGKVRQSATTNQLIHRPAATLAEISTFANLAAGDCLLTGTPGGVLAGSNLKVGLAIITNMKNDRKRREKFTEAQLARTRFLEPGDTLELSIKTPDGAIDLGTQRNIIANA